MSASLNRRGLLGLFAAAPVAAAAGMEPASALGRARYLMRSGRISALTAASLGNVEGMTRGLGIGDVGASLERVNPLTPNTPPDLTELAARTGSEPAPALVLTTTEARAIAALAVVFPPEIAAYRSFGAPMRRRLFAELLARHGGPPLPSPADPGHHYGPAATPAHHSSRGHR